MSNNVIEIKNLTKKYGNKYAIKDITFNIPKGKVIGLVGANGAGKTTLSEIIAGITAQTSGEVKYNYDYKVTPQEKLGMQFQESTYPSGLTVKDIISFARNIHKIKISQKQLRDILNQFQMGNFYNRKVKVLSGGQRQKLNILLSMLHRPEFVILDELTTGLDISSREEVIKFTKELIKSHNISAIIISHHMHEIEALSDEIIVLSHGEMVDLTSIEKIKKKHDSLDQYMVNFINDHNKNINVDELESASHFTFFSNMYGKIVNKYKGKK